MDQTTRLSRNTWTALTDAQLLAQCAVDTYRASGPGGQKRNKTSSAVRIRHQPTGLIVIAEESRSQHENRAKALKRLREALFLKLRDRLPAVPGSTPTNDDSELLKDYLDSGQRLRLGKKDRRFWPAAGIVLDALHDHAARVSEAASALGISTGNLIDFLQISPKLWEQANLLRAEFGQKPLKNN